MILSCLCLFFITLVIKLSLLSNYVGYNCKDSQAAKRNNTLASVTPLSNTATAGSKSLSRIHELSMTAVDNTTNPESKRKRQTKLVGVVGHTVMITDAEAT